MNPRLLLIPLILIASFNTYAEKPLAPKSLEGTTAVITEDVYKLTTSKADLVIIDSRRKEEYIKGHIEGSISLLNTKMTQANLKKLVATTDTPVLFYCNGARCMRSYSASKMAVNWGYKNIYWFRGGWKEWKTKELPVSR